MGKMFGRLLQRLHSKRRFAGASDWRKQIIEGSCHS